MPWAGTEPGPYIAIGGSRVGAGADDQATAWSELAEAENPSLGGEKAERSSAKSERHVAAGPAPISATGYALRSDRGYTDIMSANFCNQGLPRVQCDNQVLVFVHNCGYPRRKRRCGIRLFNDGGPL